MLISTNLQSKMGFLAKIIFQNSGVVYLSVCLPIPYIMTLSSIQLNVGTTFISQSKYIMESWHSDTCEMGHFHMTISSHSQEQFQILLFARHWHILRLTCCPSNIEICGQSVFMLAQLLHHYGNKLSLQPSHAR